MLWFEADLYDQLQIVQILARLRELDVPPSRIKLICVGEHVGIARFGGLAELNGEQLSRLPATALTSAALELASRAWAALRAPDPAGLGAITGARSPELRFVGEAFDRLGREYPSTRDGLSLTERRVLAVILAGTLTARAAFVRGAAREARPFLGDSWCFERMARMAGGSTPLLEIEPAGPVRQNTRVRLTAAGRSVLDGRADQVALNGVDRWIGGVHLKGSSSPWRWDEGTETIVRADR